MNMYDEPSTMKTKSVIAVELDERALVAQPLGALAREEAAFVAPLLHRAIAARVQRLVAQLAQPLEPRLRGLVRIGHAAEPNLLSVRRRLPPSLQIRGFALLWSSLLTNGLASQMLAVAIGWQVYSIRRNPLDLGLVGLTEFVPLPILALPAGQLADRLPRRAVTAASYLVGVGIAVALVFVTLAGAHALWPYLSLAAVTGIAQVVGNPAGRAMTPEIVPQELIPGALALRSVGSQIGVIAGPALGGVVFAVEPVA